MQCIQVVKTGIIRGHQGLLTGESKVSLDSIFFIASKLLKSTSQVETQGASTTCYVALSQKNRRSSSPSAVADEKGSEAPAAEVVSVVRSANRNSNPNPRDCCNV
ncbi:hypothetical protein Ahy_B03g068733 [Arachis hypogaea]|uniref:Uncharacterized protein n=1 Tax=Arachis hypogaea TaxID=3818 RepID=A0A445AAQ4_ARAHY|nr:hypothetical protein Ahy_B03g068733 [Arachis hypogaea]